jgi:hypothetical protein
MDCKRQEAKRLGTGLQIRVSGFDSRLAVHFCGKKTTSLKQKTSHHATTGNHPTTLRRPNEVRRVFLLPTVISVSHRKNGFLYCPVRAFRPLPYGIIPPKLCHFYRRRSGGSEQVLGVFRLPVVVSGSLMPTTLMPVVFSNQITLSPNSPLCPHIVPVQYSLTSLI